MGSKPWDFSGMGHLVSGFKMGSHLPPNGYALSLSLPHLTCSLVWTDFPNRVINRHLRGGRLCAADGYRFSVDLLAAYCVQQVLFHTFDVPVDRETLPHGCLRGL